VLKYLGEAVDFKKKHHKVSAIGYIVAKENGVVKSIKGIDKIKNHQNVTRYLINVKENDGIKVPRNSDDRLGYVIMTDDDPNLIKDKMKKLLDEVVIEVSAY